MFLELSNLILDITEVETTEKGNFYEKRNYTVDNGIKIEADEFNYDKISNILKTKGKVKVLDEINEYVIYSDEIIYLKNEENFYLWKFKGNKFEYQNYCSRI